MLTYLEISDFALLEAVTLQPGPGLVVLTGETGAGKSLLIDAITALSGRRVQSEMVRYGQPLALVQAIFTVEPGLLPAQLKEDLGLAGDNELELTLAREITAGGKSACRINGRLTNMATLQELADCLIDIHGQHDQQAIFLASRHQEMLDRFAGADVAQALASYQKILVQYKKCQRELQDLGSDPAARARRLDILAFQVAEIAAAALKAGEDEELKEQARILANAEKITQALHQAYAYLAGAETGAVLDQLGLVLAELTTAGRYSELGQEQSEQINQAFDLLQGAASELRAAFESFEADPAELDRINQRLDLLDRLKSKYGGSLDRVLLYHEKAAAELERLSCGAELYEKLHLRLLAIKEQLLDQAGRLSAKRRKAAQLMQAEIAAQLADLGMQGVSFQTSFAPLPAEPASFPELGLDKLEFLLSANPGEPPRPLIKIASGGEASRIMLAIKAVLATADQIPVLVFDEIDTGVSGKTAGKVAEKLFLISQKRQVFCITHMAQIAAMADQHWLIEKKVEEGRTATVLQCLSEPERELELARLLSGGIGDQAARQLAGQLLSSSSKFKDHGAAAPAGA